MTEDKPIAKPIIDDATREKMALMFSGEVYLPDDVPVAQMPSVWTLLEGEKRANSTPRR